jgi:hypothetical protein
MLMDLQTILGTETHLSEGQCLDEKLHMVKLRCICAGSRMSTLPEQA